MSGNSEGKKNLQGQRKVREFYFESGKIVLKLENWDNLTQLIWYHWGYFGVTVFLMKFFLMEEGKFDENLFDESLNERIDRAVVSRG